MSRPRPATMEPSAPQPATPTNPDKPFRTIEVLDARTKQICKVACMSCIRGHRTTSCGIPVCRMKIFWTVKRPGRPSNSCTCRFGASGRCQCVVARSACPHKAKKGEKRRAGECRCDEQGRFCCLLEPGDWDVLCNLGNPKVQFFGSREDLEAGGSISRARDSSLQIGSLSLPPTPAYSVASPQSGASMPGTPTPIVGDGMRSINTNDYNLGETASPARPATRFGMMGLGAPLGDEYVGQDVLAWDGQSPQAPRDFQPYHELETYQPPPTPQQQLTTPTAPSPFQPLPYPHQNALPISPPPSFPPLAESFSTLTLPPTTQSSTFDFQTFISEYTSYQLPTAICQHCGMNGCTCKNCPAVMQNFESGSWAQCCSRKHVRAGPQAPAIAAHVGTGAQRGLSQQQQQMVAEGVPTMTGGAGGGGCCGSRSQPIAGFDPVFTEQMDVDHELKMLAAPHATLEEQAPTIDLSEFLMQDVQGESSSLDNDGGGYGCCCGD